MNLPLAESEKEEILAAYKAAEASLTEAGRAMDKLAKTTDKRIAYLSGARIQQLRKILDESGYNLFMLGAQEHKVKNFGLNRVIE